MIGGFSAHALLEYQRLMSEAVGDSHDFTECVDVYDFRLCQRKDGSFYGTAGRCVKGVEASKTALISALREIIEISPEQETKLKQMTEKQVLRVAADIKGRQKKAQPKQPKKRAGQGIMLPKEAEAFANFYAAGGRPKQPRYVSDEELDSILDKLDPKERRAWIRKAASMGDPSRGEGNWASSEERARAVLKFLIGHDFKDATGVARDWRTEIQLDHGQGLKLGGKDDPSNWVILPISTNQRKGDIEKGVINEVKSGLIPMSQAKAEVYKRLEKKLRENAAMSEEQVRKVYQAGFDREAEKARIVKMHKDNLPLMTSEQRLSLIEGAKSKNLKLLFQASTYGFYRLKKGSDERGDYPRVGAMRALIKMRWGYPLTEEDLKNLEIDAVGQPEGYRAKLEKNYKAR
jgi:hypothetical protein